MDELREKSVFSELIGGQRQQENPETENDDEPSIDTGLIGDDNVDDVEVSTQYLNNCFNFDVCLSICVCVQKLAPFPAVLS